MKQNRLFRNDIPDFVKAPKSSSLHYFPKTGGRSIARFVLYITNVPQLIQRLVIPLDAGDVAPFVFGIRADPGFTHLDFFTPIYL